jgi:hypothetical protein
MSFANGALSLTSTVSGSGGQIKFLTSTNGTSASETMRINSAGQLLLGKTAFDSSIEGFMVDSRLFQTTDGGTTAFFNRLTSDGDIVEFRKNGTTVGSIVATGNRLAIGDASVGLRFADDFNNIQPYNVTTLALNDNAIDLGSPAGRFKDLHLSGGVVFDAAGGTGTGSSNTLDEYERGTFVLSSPHVTLTNASGSYIRVGDLVHVSMLLILPVSGSATGVNITGLPFTPWNNNSNRGGLSIGYISGATLGDITTLINVSSNVINFYIGSSVQSYGSLSGRTIYLGGTYTAA